MIPRITELGKPNGWILIDEVDVCQHVEGAQGIVDTFIGIMSYAEQRSIDHHIGLRLVPLLNSADVCSINVRTIDFPLNRISSGILCLALCLAENDLVLSTDPTLGALGKWFKLALHRAYSSPIEPAGLSFIRLKELQKGWLRDFDTNLWKATSTLILVWTRKGIS